MEYFPRKLAGQFHFHLLSPFFLFLFLFFPTSLKCWLMQLVLTERYGKSATCLDLTGNELKSLIYLEQFTAVSELILDNNGLKDGLSLPPMIQLKTLSLNKNELTDVEMLIEEIKEKTPNISYVLQFLEIIGLF